MDRGEMEHMLAGSGPSERLAVVSPVCKTAAFERDVAQLSDDAADFQAPVGIEVNPTPSQSP